MLNLGEKFPYFFFKHTTTQSVDI